MVAFESTDCRNTTYSKEMTILEMRVHTAAAIVPSSPLAWHLVYEKSYAILTAAQLCANIDEGTTKVDILHTSRLTAPLQCFSSFILLRADPALNHEICVSLKV